MIRFVRTSPRTNISSIMSSDWRNLLLADLAVHTVSGK